MKLENKVALVGASSTGKTTVYELLKSSLPDYKFINESTRTVAEYGFPINEKGTSETQLAISSFHLESLLTTENTILDRCYLDLLVYSNHMRDISKETYNYIFDTWMRVHGKYTHFIYFPIEFESVDDGVRSVDESWRKNIDAHFHSTLKGLNLVGQEYLTVTGSPKQRVKQILEFIK